MKARRRSQEKAHAGDVGGARRAVGRDVLTPPIITQKSPKVNHPAVIEARRQALAAADRGDYLAAGALLDQFYAMRRQLDRGGAK